jgi:outer membrane protein assembly factor BamB
VVYAASHSGVLAAIDARSGARIWSTSLGSRQGPVVEGDFLFIVSTEGKVLCFNRVDGKVVWARDLQGYKNVKEKRDRIVWIGPLVASNRLVVASSTGQVLALSPQDGKTVAEANLKYPVYIEPIAAAGKIFIVTDEGVLVALK